MSLADDTCQGGLDESLVTVGRYQYCRVGLVTLCRRRLAEQRLVAAPDVTMTRCGHVLRGSRVRWMRVPGATPAVHQKLTISINRAPGHLEVCELAFDHTARCVAECLP